MPLRSKRECKAHGCHVLTRNGYCEAHENMKPAAHNDRHKLYNQYDRSAEDTAFYSSKEWRQLRPMAIARDNGLCVHCLANKRVIPFKEIDHIIPLRVDRSKALQLDNLQCLCKQCHTRKTYEDRKNYATYYK